MDTKSELVEVKITPAFITEAANLIDRCYLEWMALAWNSGDSSAILSRGFVFTIALLASGEYHTPTDPPEPAMRIVQLAHLFCEARKIRESEREREDETPSVKA